MDLQPGARKLVQLLHAVRKAKARHGGPRATYLLYRRVELDIESKLFEWYGIDATTFSVANKEAK